MKFFADTIIKPYIIESGYRRICEIGASFGENTDTLLGIESVAIDIIDPCLDADLGKKYQHDKRIQVHKDMSLNVLREMSGQFDCILIDGDHNWYTVYNELRMIDERGLIKEGGTIFFHDVCWPYARRDMYYRPELIPPEFIHPYDRAGIVYGKSKLSNVSIANASLCNAIYEGGPRNGVLTAVEDFLKENRGKYKFFRFEEEYGLGVLLKTVSTIANVTFNRYLLKAKSRIPLRRLKNVASHKFPALYSSLTDLRNRTRRALGNK
jgi:hypothetical protein